MTSYHHWIKMTYCSLLKDQWRHSWMTYKEKCTKIRYEWHAENSMSSRPSTCMDWIKLSLQQKLIKLHAIKGILLWITQGNDPSWNHKITVNYFCASTVRHPAFMRYSYFIFVQSISRREGDLCTNFSRHDFAWVSVLYHSFYFFLLSLRSKWLC